MATPVWADTRADAWPHTNRVLPWLLAGLLVMIYLVPFDSITLPVHLPVGADLDRFVLGVVFVAWLVVVIAGQARPRFRRTPINVALGVLLLVVVLSLAFNLRPLAWDGELKYALKNTSLLLSFIVFFYLCATTIRPSEVRPYAKLIVILACLTALGTLYEYDTGVNPFFSLAADVLGANNVDTATVAAFGNTAINSISTRLSVTGPAVHGLADATIMSAAVPFALAFAASAARRRDAIFWLASVALLIGGNIATGRKTGLLVPAVSIIVLVVYEPRTYARFLPLIPLALVALEIVAPTAISRLVYQLAHASSSSSTQTRLSDYGAVQPYILTHLLIGRGYGSFDPFKYRILDNEMLDLLVEVGVMGTVAWIGVVVTTMFTAHRAALGDGLSRRLMHGIVAFAVGFFVSNFTYDTFSFRQAPYIFFFMAALATAQFNVGRDPDPPPDIRRPAPPQATRRASVVREPPRRSRELV